jgi:hypothetical protein
MITIPTANDNSIHQKAISKTKTKREMGKREEGVGGFSLT